MLVGRVIGLEVSCFEAGKLSLLCYPHTQIFTDLLSVTNSMLKKKKKNHIVCAFYFLICYISLIIISIFIYVIAYVHNLILFITVSIVQLFYLSIIWVGHNLFISSLVSRHFCFFSSLAITNKAAKHINYKSFYGQITVFSLG